MQDTDKTADAPAADWRDGLPPELREDASLRDIRDVAALAKSYVHAQRLVGAERIAVPGRNATDEDWQRLFERLGRPATPEAYALERPQDGAAPYDEALENAFRSRAHALGLLPQQARGLHEWWLGAQAAALREAEEGQQAGRAAAEARLREGWGAGYERQMGAANAALRRFADAELQARLGEGLGNDPAFIQFCARIGALLAEDRLAGAGGPEAGAGDAKRRIAEVLADRAHPYFNNRDPRHGHAVDYVRGLFESAYGEARP